MSSETATNCTIAEYSSVEVALSDLAVRYRDVLYPVTTPLGMIEAKKARMEIRNYRTGLEKKRVEIKGPALERCRMIDTEAKRITTALSALEDPIDQQIKKEETRKEEAALAVQRAEADRLAAEERAKKDAEETRMAEERAELDRRQAEIDKAERESREKIEAEQRAETERRRKADEEARATIEAAERESRRKIEERERAARLKMEEDERAARKEREAKEAALKAEREKLEAERRVIEEQARKEREAKEAKEREALRKLNEVSDGHALLVNFVSRFGDLPEFAGIASTINTFLTGGKQ